MPIIFRNYKFLKVKKIQNVQEMVEPTSVISFRINKKLKQALEEECELKNVSVNSILNKMVDNHLKWESFAEEMGLIFLTKAIFREILSKMSDRELKILATTICRSAFKNATLYMKGEFNYQNLIEVVDMWLSHSHVPYRRISANSHEKYILQHDLSEKYSLYLYTSLTTILAELNCLTQNAHLEDQTLSFEIYKSDTK
jgi:hypothetical protein